MTGYELSKQWFDFVRDNPEQISPNHHALYFWVCEKWNSLGKPEKFGLPSGECMFIMGINSYKTFKKTFDSMVELGFFDVVQHSKNQYTSNIIALAKNTKAHTKASPTHLPTHVQSKDTIYKDINNKITKDINGSADDVSIAEKQKQEKRENNGYDLGIEKVETAKQLFADEKVGMFLNKKQLSAKQGAVAIQDFVDFCDMNEKFPRTYYDSRSHFYNWMGKKDINIYRQ